MSWAPKVPTAEERAESIAHMERIGHLDPKCSFCQREFYARTDRLPEDIHAPRHKALGSCRSGGYPHCTCDTCF